MQHWERSQLLPGSSHSLEGEQVESAVAQSHTFPQPPQPLEPNGSLPELGYSPTLGDQAPYAGVAPWFQGVIAGDIPPIGLGAEPKNIPVAAKKPRVSHQEQYSGVNGTLPYPPQTQPGLAAKALRLTSSSPKARDIGWDLHAIFALLSIKQEVKTPSASWSKLA